MPILENPRHERFAQLFKQFMDNESFKRWMTNTVFDLTYEHAETEGLVGGQ